jgi:hypothetical protein
MHRDRIYLVSPDGKTGAWLHPLDLTTGHYPQYDKWIDATDLTTEEFDVLIMRLQEAA